MHEDQNLVSDRTNSDELLDSKIISEDSVDLNKPQIDTLIKDIRE